MTLLLDTCVFIWLTQEPDKLSAAARTAINDSNNRLIFSQASAWEIHLKHHAGKLILPPMQQFSFWRRSAGFQPAWRVGVAKLPAFSGDLGRLQTGAPPK